MSSAFPRSGFGASREPPTEAPLLDLGDVVARVGQGILKAAGPESGRRVPGRDPVKAHPCGPPNAAQVPAMFHRDFTGPLDTAAELARLQHGVA